MVQGARLQMPAFQFVREQLRLLQRNLSHLFIGMDQIDFVSNEQNLQRVELRMVGLEFLKPIAAIEEGLVVGHVVYQEHSVGLLKVVPDNASVLLLASSLIYRCPKSPPLFRCRSSVGLVFFHTRWK